MSLHCHCLVRIQCCNCLIEASADLMIAVIDSYISAPIICISQARNTAQKYGTAGLC